MTIDSLHNKVLHMLLDSFADGVYITDLDRKILYWNDAARKITGWDTKEVQGKYCYDGLLCHVDSEGNTLCGDDNCPLHQAIINKESSRLPVIVFAKGKRGERIPVEVTVAPVVGENGEVVGGIESFRDLGPLMEDLKHARKIQLHAMETKLNKDDRIQISAHNIPYEYVSGDFYRVEQLTNDSYIIFMADIMGHGISSALYSMTIRSIWEEARNLLSSPVEFCSHLNNQLFNISKDDDSFATAVMGVVNLSKMKFNFIRAGHPAPLLIRKNTATHCGTPNPALGLFPDGDFSENQIDIQTGDKLYAYTDGAAEIKNADGEELGKDGLAELIINNQKNGSGMELIKNVESHLLEYSEHMTFNDDLTLVEIIIK